MVGRPFPVFSFLAVRLGGLYISRDFFHILWKLGPSLCHGLFFPFPPFLPGLPTPSDVEGRPPASFGHLPLHPTDTYLRAQRLTPVLHSPSNKAPSLGERSSDEPAPTNEHTIRFAGDRGQHDPPRQGNVREDHLLVGNCGNAHRHRYSIPRKQHPAGRL